MRCDGRLFIILPVAPLAPVCPPPLPPLCAMAAPGSIRAPANKAGAISRYDRFMLLLQFSVASALNLDAPSGASGSRRDRWRIRRPQRSAARDGHLPRASTAKPARTQQSISAPGLAAMHAASPQPFCIGHRCALAPCLEIWKNTLSLSGLPQGRGKTGTAPMRSRTHSGRQIGPAAAWLHVADLIRSQSSEWPLSDSAAPPWPAQCPRPGARSSRCSFRRPSGDGRRRHQAASGAVAFVISPGRSTSRRNTSATASSTARIRGTLRAS